MPTHQLHQEKGETYFITFTCYEWMSLFGETDIFDYFEKWFQYLNKNHSFLLGYVIMPNHFHGLIHVGDKCQVSLNRLVGNGKRFLAYEIIKRLKKHRREDILAKLRRGVQQNEKLVGKKHQVFRLSFDAKICFDMKMLETKLDYIHYNPTSGKWNLVHDWTTYPYSSAAYYESRKENRFVTHYKDIWG